MSNAQGYALDVIIITEYGEKVKLIQTIYQKKQKTILPTVKPL